MPKVEQYGPSRVNTQVATEARAQSAPAGAFGGQLAQGVNQLGAGLQQMKTKIDTAAAEEALVKFEKDKNNLFFNPENGYFNSQGRDAYERAGTVAEELEKLKRSYGEGLKSQTARDAFDKAAQQHITRSGADIMRHASKGVQAWEVATINAQVENTLENASLYWNDPERREVQRALGRQSILDAGKLEGIDGTALNERLQTYESSFSMAAIQSAASKSADEGDKLLSDMRDRLEGPDVLKAESMIAKRRQAEQTASNANLAVLRAGNLVDTYGDATDARSSILEEVNQIEDGELRKATMSEAMKQLDAKRKADSETKGAIFEEGENFIMGGGTVEQFKSQHAEEWEQLTPKQKRALNSGESLATDYVVLSDLMTLPKTKLAQINPTDYYSDLAKPDRQKLISAVASARNGGTDHQVGRTRNAETTASVEQIFGAKKGWNQKEKARVNQFYQIINDEAEAREQQKGSPLTSQEYTDLVNGMTRKVVKERSLWFDKEMDLTDIPTEDLGVLSDYLRQNNIPVTSDNLIRAHEQASK